MSSSLTGACRQRNMRDLNMICRRLHRAPLPPTCRGATSPDTALFSPEVAAWITKVSVLSESHSDARSVVVFRLAVPASARTVQQIRLPRVWLELPVKEVHFKTAYEQCAAESPATLEHCGQRVESMVDKASCLSQHDTQESFPSKIVGRPRKYRGRCQPRASHPVLRRMLLKVGRKGDFKPSCEVLRFATSAKVKQVRRIKTCMGRLQRYPHGWLPPQAIEPLMLEWNAILQARGLARSNFSEWCELGPPSLGLPTAEY